MANTVAMVNGFSSSSSYSSRVQLMNSRTKNTRIGICSISASAATISDPYRTLKVHRGASKSEVKKAFRQLALQYHPDVCRGNNSGVQFHHINEAYDMVMSQIRGETIKQEIETYNETNYDEGTEESSVMGMDEPDLELWEEWMGWEGAGIRDYSSHINPYL